MTKLNQIGLIVMVLTIASGCTREFSKSSTIKLQLPGDSSAFHHSKVSGAAKDFTTFSGGSSTGGWGLSDPSEINQIGCYAVLVESPSPAGPVQSCTTVNGTVVAKPWLSAGAYVAGSVIELSVASGPARKINLIGFKASSAAACTNFNANGGPSRHLLSAPFIIGSKTVDLSPNGQTDVDIVASLTGSTKFKDCAGWGEAAISSPAFLVLDTSMNEGSSYAYVAVSLTTAATNDMEFELNVTSGGSATYMSDYADTIFNGVISVGQVATYIPVSIIDDNLYEANETVHLSLSPVTAGAAVADSIGIITITDNDVAPTISIAPASITEGTTALLVANLSQASGTDAFFNYATLPGTATAGSDYTSSSGVVTILAGALSTAFQFSTIDDGTSESNEYFTVTFSSMTGISGGTTTADVTILDNDVPTPMLTVFDASAIEGNTLLFVVSMSMSSGSPVTVDYNTTNVTAMSAIDYVANTGILTFAPGDTIKYVSVAVIDDNLEEIDETMNLNLSNAVNATVIDNTGLGTISASDPSVLFINDAVADENDGTISFVVFTSSVPMNDVTFAYASVSQSALSAVDFDNSIGVMTISAGITMATIHVPLIEDLLYETTETFEMSLSSLSNATAGDMLAVGSIFDTDSPPQLYVTSTNFSEFDIATIVVSLDTISAVPVTFDYSTTDGSALVISDYTSMAGVATILPGSLTVGVTIALTDDNDVEGYENFFLEISNPIGATIYISSGAIGLLDDDGWQQESFLKASNADSSDVFGRSVNISSDYAVVGAPQESSANTTVTNGTGSSSDNSAVNSGAAYVYKRTSMIWEQVAFLKASNSEGSDNFGNNVAISNDLVAVTASGEDSNQTTISLGTISSANNSSSQSGAVYVFKRTGASWQQEAYIKASNAESMDEFGESINIDGNTLVVTSTQEDSNASGVINGTASSANNSMSSSGAAYVYVRNNGTWSQQAFLKAANPAANGQFGVSTSILGDTIAVGASMEDSNLTGVISGTGATANTSAANSGAVYVFKRTGSTWQQEAFIKAGNTSASDNFGEAVAIHGHTLLVGAGSESSSQTTITMGTGGPADNATTGAGAAYIFKRTGTTWQQEAFLKPSNNKDSQYFGSSVSLWGDLAAVGAFYEPSSTTDIINGGASAFDISAAAGAAYIFRRSGSSWKQEAYIKSANSSPDDYFARKLALHGDTLIVGAEGEDSNGKTILNGSTAPFEDSSAQSGASYIYTNSGALVTIIRQDPAQMDPAGGLPIKFVVEFSRAINPATFTTSDISNIGTATGITWTLTNSGDDRVYTLEATAGSAGTYVPTISYGTVLGAEGLPAEANHSDYDHSVNY